MNELTWLEVSKEALSNNVRQIRGLIGDNVILCPVVKGNAYGHGLVECGKIFLEAGADWLGVNALYEAKNLREAGIDSPIYILGYVPLNSLEEAAELDCRLVVYNQETVDRLHDISNENGKIVNIHLKAETGNNRQGIGQEEILEIANKCKSGNVKIEGLCTHFANIEDTTDHSYAEKQLKLFKEIDQALKKAGVNIPIKHCANSAATILFPETHFQMVRTGLMVYGMWPSKETKDQAEERLDLVPAATWKARIAQIKNLDAGQYIGYGCTFKTNRKTRLAIIPVGYYNGYDRGVSGKAHVLIHGKKAPVLGRVCMNIIMVDVTDIPEAELEDEAVLIGRDGEEEISAEQYAQWADTINYEAITRVNERIPRIVTDQSHRQPQSIKRKCYKSYKSLRYGPGN